MAKALDRHVYQQAVVRLKRGDSRKQVAADLNLPESTVGKVSVHAGVAKVAPEVKKRDVEAVERWLQASKDAEKRPAAKTTAKKREKVGASA